MSTRDDARLTAQERAALSNLEALAAADDPQLAARLRGPNHWIPLLRLPAIPGWIHSLWLAAPAVVVGLVLTVVGLSVGLVVGVVGACLAAAGLWSLVAAAERRWGGG
ncbi:MAG TPA: DUF3040 domain-containing protein [Acidimicrobiales bacterium]